MSWKDSFLTRISWQGSFVVDTVTECASVERDERPKLHPSPREQRVIVSWVKIRDDRDHYQQDEDGIRFHSSDIVMIIMFSADPRRRTPHRSAAATAASSS